MIFFILAAFLGLLGAVGDICVEKWILKDMNPTWWTISACLFLMFMTGLGYCIRLGTAKGYSLATIVIIVILMNILGVLAWDSIKGEPITYTKILGILLAVAAIICLEKK
jgi:drug/metabolite transporter (DMT)-like permease